MAATESSRLCPRHVAAFSTQFDIICSPFELVTERAEPRTLNRKFSAGIALPVPVVSFPVPILARDGVCTPLTENSDCGWQQLIGDVLRGDERISGMIRGMQCRESNEAEVKLGKQKFIRTVRLKIQRVDCRLDRTMSRLVYQAFGEGKKVLDLYDDVLQAPKASSLAQLRKAYYKQVR